MVRDILGSERKEPMEFGYEELPAASNVASIMLVASDKKVDAPIYVQSYGRNGVTAPYGNVGVKKIDKNFAILPITGGVNIVTSTERYPDEEGVYSEDEFFMLSLERVDDGFVMGYTDPDGTYSESKIDGADRVGILDEDNMYVGFFASRNAKMTVANVHLTTSDANTNRIGFEAASYAVDVGIFSGNTSSTEEYTIRLHSNYDGRITIKQDSKTILTNHDIEAGKFFEYTTLLINDETQFEVIYALDQSVISPSVKTVEYIVRKNIAYKNKDIYVAVDGLSIAEGTLESPLDLQTALEYLSPGYRIYLRGGNYGALDVKRSYSGNTNALKGLISYEGERAVFNGTSYLRGSYWQIKDVNITGSSTTGFRVTGHENIVEGCRFYGNKDTGCQMSGGTGTDPLTWPKNNLFLNCEAYDNVDDGWDLYNKLEDGGNYPVTIEDCIVYENGILLDGPSIAVGSIGNGFKLGGEGQPVNHMIRNCMAFNNNMDGFTCNFNPGEMTVEGCTSFDNARCNYIFRSNPYRTPAEQGNFIRNISFRTDNNYGIDDFISGNIESSYFFCDGNNTVSCLEFKNTVAPNSQY